MILQRSSHGDEHARWVYAHQVPIVASFFVATDDSKAPAPRFAAVRVDASHRPDVRDLGRVLHSEGIDEGGGAWGILVPRDSIPLAVLSLAIRRPVTCDLTLLWRLDESRAFLEELAGLDVLAVTVADPEERGLVAFNDGVLVWHPRKMLAAVLRWSPAE